MGEHFHVDHENAYLTSISVFELMCSKKLPRLCADEEIYILKLKNCWLVLLFLLWILLHNMEISRSKNITDPRIKKFIKIKKKEELVITAYKS